MLSTWDQSKNMSPGTELMYLKSFNKIAAKLWEEFTTQHYIYLSTTQISMQYHP